MSTAQMPSLANDMNSLIYQRMLFLEGIVAGYGQDILNLKNEVCRLSKGFDSSNVLPREIPKSTATSFVFEASPSVARAAEDSESDSDLLDDQSSYSSVDASTTSQPVEMNSSKLPIIIVKPEPVATEAPDQQQSQQPPTRSPNVATLILPGAL
ncbi:hypothetical protein HDU79_010399 [Rhizoclosmatium sp. JEL0117]|nr:hypothetical protein HDU79_010399 [Rhizoclosmatium sp. JEL0117]